MINNKMLFEYFLVIIINNNLKQIREYKPKKDDKTQIIAGSKDNQNQTLRTKEMLALPSPPKKRRRKTFFLHHLINHIPCRFAI